MIDPYYIPEIMNTATSSGDISELTQIVEEIQDILNGTGSTEGLIEKVNVLSRAIDELIESSKFGIEYKTTAEWEADQEISKKGYIYIYSDAKEIEGQKVPRIKIGNGINRIKDIYFVDQDIVNALNNIVTVTAEEKESWNNKVSCSIDPQEENLIFSK